MPLWATILVSCLGTGGIIGFIEFLIQRHDSRNGLLRKIVEEQKKQEKDSIRTQLLLMMSDYPHEHQEILMLGHRYFHDLHSNWYLTTLFENYLRSEGIPIPHWFEASTHTDTEVGKE